MTKDRSREPNPTTPDSGADTFALHQGGEQEGL